MRSGFTHWSINLSYHTAQLNLPFRHINCCTVDAFTLACEASFGLQEKLSTLVGLPLVIGVDVL
jgi:hypothetical protein